MRSEHRRVVQALPHHLPREVEVHELTFSSRLLVQVHQHAAIAPHPHKQLLPLYLALAVEELPPEHREELSLQSSPVNSCFPLESDLPLLSPSRRLLASHRVERILHKPVPPNPQHLSSSSCRSLRLERSIELSLPLAERFSHARDARLQEEVEGSLHYHSIWRAEDQLMSRAVRDGDPRAARKRIEANVPLDGEGEEAGVKELQACQRLNEASSLVNDQLAMSKPELDIHPLLRLAQPSGREVDQA
mmetsp:Transcript_6919/g.24228  ORF Transcript_6919/g.24228 Transcript_6919/m.24228 type:complete len:247 (+) Transcript_6919:1535-2275(+)